MPVPSGKGNHKEEMENVVMKRSIYLIPVLLLLLLTASCGVQGQEQGVTRTSYMLDTIINITLYGGEEKENEALLTQTMEEINRLENLLSVERAGSDLDRLAKAAGKEWVEISPECEEVLTQAKEYWSLSGGHFDVTTGPLIDLWHIRNGEGHYPTQEELAQTLPLISSEWLQVEKGRAYLAHEGMKANLGAIAKGYIADRVKVFLLDRGVEHALIDLGRNILLIGGKPDGGEFHIGVQDPFDPEVASARYVLKTQDKSVVTSGVYERYFEYEGVRYHHVLDPFTGFPADRGVVSATIVSDDSAQGDALSTTCLLLGPEEGLAVIESIPGVEALLIGADGQEWFSSGFEAYLAD